MSDYCTLSDVKGALRITDNIDDTLLNTAIDAASRWIDGWCERTFTVASGTATRDFVPSGRFEPLYIDDATSVLSVKIDEDLDYSFATTLRADIDYQLEPVNSRADGIVWPYYRLIPVEDGYWPVWEGRASVRVEATYGWPAIPDAVKTACIFQASRIYTRFSSPAGVVSFGDMGAIRVSRMLDPEVEALLSPYRRKQFF
ncbi:MAG TPA: phage head-tail connector protein [Acidimicrobiia bacterium]